LAEVGPQKDYLFFAAARFLPAAAAFTGPVELGGFFMPSSNDFRMAA